jgi:MFS family permease
MAGKIESERLWGKDFIIIMIASAGISFCNYFFFSTLPIYARMLSGSTVYAGLMTGVYTLAAMVVRPLAGTLSDRFGRTRLLIAGAFVCAIACVLYDFAGGLMILLVVRMLNGIGFGAHSTCAGAVAADIIPKSRMAEGLGIFGLYGTLAAAVAPGIALTIVGTGGTEGFRALFVLAAVVSFASMLADCFITYERKRTDRPAREPPLETHTQGNGATVPKTWLGFEYAVLAPAVVVVLLHVAMSSVTSFLTLFVLERHLGNVGLFFTFNAAGLFLSRVLCGKIVDRRGTNVVVIPALIVLAVCFALVPFARSLSDLYLVSVPLGLAQGAVVPAIYAMMFNRCSPMRRGTASAAFSSSIDIGFGVGSILFGFIAAGFDYYVVYLGAALFSVLALIVYRLRLAKG